MKLSAREIIYIIDDNEPVLEALTRIFESDGFKVESFSGPLEYLEFIQTLSDQLPMVSLIDIYMPLMNGYELMYHATMINPKLRFITMTAGCAIHHRNEPYIVGHLPKPFQTNTLTQTVRDYSFPEKEMIND